MDFYLRSNVYSNPLLFIVVTSMFTLLRESLCEYMHLQESAILQGNSESVYSDMSPNFDIDWTKKTIILYVIIIKLLRNIWKRVKSDIYYNRNSYFDYTKNPPLNYIQTLFLRDTQSLFLNNT